jgi:hypothetical protein
VADAATDAPLADAGIDAPHVDAGNPFGDGGSGGTSLRYEQLSLYDCRCAGSHAPIGGWPILGAIVFVIARRRSGSSSAR